MSFEQVMKSGNSTAVFADPGIKDRVYIRKVSEQVAASGNGKLMAFWMKADKAAFVKKLEKVCKKPPNRDRQLECLILECAGITA